MVDDNQKNASVIPESGIEVIPQEFYGGMKRQVQTRVEKVYVAPQAPSAAKQAPVAPTIGISQMPARPVSSLPPAPPARSVGAKLQEPKIIILAVSGLLVLVVGGAAFYYIRQAQQAKKFLAPAASQPVAQVPAAQTPSVPATVIPTSTPETPPSAGGSAPAAPPSVILPQKNYTTSPDTDNDELTDEEEKKLFGTSASKPDTDDDGYPDALEVANLYNPLGFKPQRLMDSGLILNYFNPTHQYSIYYPRQWVAQALDPNNEEIMFSSDTGEFMEMMLTSNPQRLPVKDWYLSQSPGARAEDLTVVKTKEGIEGALSPDGLTAYIPFGETIYIITYNIGLKTEVNFLSTFKMMVASFKTIGSQEAAVPPPTVPLPTETTTIP